MTRKPALVAHIEATRGRETIARAFAAHDRGCSMARCAAILSCTEREAFAFLEKAKRPTSKATAVEAEEVES